jgi:hypothetical protein
VDRLEPWPLRVVWFLLPFTAGALVDQVLTDRSTAVSTVVLVGAWGVWALTLAALLVPLPSTLTVVRITAPAAALASIVASALVLLDDETLPLVGIAGLVLAILAAGLALGAPTGDHFVDGASYGSERRFLLRVPGPLLFGPIEAAWLATVLGLITGPLLLASEQWLAGGITLAVGVPVAALAARALHGLHRRWVVLVPAGFVLHDLVALQEPVLFPRHGVARLGPALADTTATDLTQRSRGLALEVDLAPPVTVALAGRGPADLVELDAALFTPARPGALLEAARNHQLSVG